MSKNPTIKHGTGDSYYWIRPEGKGDFNVSPLVKQAAESKLKKGCGQVVIDLEAVPGMDSTFMGTLAGLAVRMQKAGRRLQLAGVGEKNRDSLEDLGLDVLMEIEPPHAVWRGKQGEIRENLKSMTTGSAAGSSDHVLKSHQQLSELNPENEKKFRTVLDMLGKDAK